MEVIARITGISRNRVSLDVFDRLISIYPEGEQTHHFWSFLPLSDPRTQAILDVLRNAGVVQSVYGVADADDRLAYSLRLERVYEPEDFRGIEWVEFKLESDKQVRHCDYRDPQDRLKLDTNLLPSNLDFAWPMFKWFLVPDRVRRLLDKSDLKGIVFRETVVLDGDLYLSTTPSRPWAAYDGEPWWELDTDCTMPPLSDTMTFTDKIGKTLTERTYANGFHRRDGLYTHAELHYRESALKELTFDLARTHEAFTNGKEHRRLECPMVASERFYHFCRAHGLKVDWAPVRIDPD